ncbi:MAG: hypothetical protein WD830_03935 [Chloroflexota bacterium]
MAKIYCMGEGEEFDSEEFDTGRPDGLIVHERGQRPLHDKFGNPLGSSAQVGGGPGVYAPYRDAPDRPPDQW